MTLQPSKITIHTVGDSQVAVHSFGALDAPYALISVHANETTAIEAAKLLIRRGRPLVLHTLVHKTSRRVSVRFGTKTITVDPNRIFTHQGIAVELDIRRFPSRSAWVPPITQLAAELVARFEIPSRPVAISIHNNTQKGSLTVHHYAKGKPQQKEASDVFAAAENDPDDFYYVTTPALFQQFKTMGYNVVLQHGQATDDGSLSYYCAAQNIPYVNVEVEAAGASMRTNQKQTQMLMILDAVFVWNKLSGQPQNV
ncbi:MAG: hypothetical protein HUU55_08660 [Myxococcales bacterium]|nr:hypothetical protein [Myxococcales bacterium]